MKKTILPALAMLIISAVMLSTASYAWFAMNASVEAESMSVNIKSDSTYLVIKAIDNDDPLPGNILTQVQSDKDIKVAGKPLDKKDTNDDGTLDTPITDIYPAAWRDIVTPDDVDGITGETFKTATNWYKAESNDGDDSTADPNSVEDLTSTAEYVVRYRYVVALQNGSPEADGLWITNFKMIETGNTVADAGVEPVRVVITCGDVYDEFYDDDLSVGGDHYTSTKNFADGTVTDQEYHEFFVYVYYNGNHVDVTSNNFVNLSAVTISFSITTNNPNT